MIVATAEEVGALIRAGRHSRRWSQKELAARVGVSRQWVVTIEAGAPTAQLELVLEALRAVGYAVDVTVSDPDDALERLDEGESS